MDLLLIDDEASLRRTLRTTLESMRHNAAEAGSGEQALYWLRKQRFDVAFLDLRLGREAGMDLLPLLLRKAPALAVVVITAHASIASAVEAMRAGAFDYLPKPFTPDQLRVVLERWQQVRRLRNRVASLEEQVRAVTPETDLETQEPLMRQAIDLAFQVAASEATLLLRGESGTGKGVLARAIHERSPRASGPLVIVHCPSLSGELLESELFGHVRGAFTGAVLDTEGKVVAAEGGSLFLDEIADLPPTVQPKLLRLLQDRCYERVGETTTRLANVRIIAASNRDLSAEVAAGRFREDLFYRLNVIDIELPSLRKRRATSCRWPNICCAFSRGRRGRRFARSRRRRSRLCCGTNGPATSANCATPSSAASSWRRRRRSIASIYRGKSATHRRRGSRLAER